MLEGFFHLSDTQRQRPSTGLVPKCGACGLYKKCNSPKMKPWGKGRKRILIVGDSPSETDDENGKPFTGTPGSFLREQAGRSGLDFKNDIKFTNALICHPTARLKGDEVEHCHPNLARTIEEFKPNVVIPMGHGALKSVLGPYWKSDLGPLDRWVGFKIPLKQHWVCPIWHPSYIIRETDQNKQKVLENMFLRYLTDALELQEEPKSPGWNFDKNIQVLMNEKEIESAIEYFITKGGWAAVDYEGNCLKPDSAHEGGKKPALHSFAVSNGETTISFPWLGKVPSLVSKLLLSKSIRKIAANCKFEQRWTLNQLGHPIKRLDWDTMIAAHILDNRPGICSLKFQMFTQLGIPSYNENVEPYLKSTNGHYNRIQEIELSTLLNYGGMDVAGEYWLAMKQREELGLTEND